MQSAIRHKVLILIAAILSACVLWLAAKADPARAIVPADCTIIGTEGHDNGVASPALVGTPGDDVICGLGGNDTIRGDAGNDELVGGAGDDSLDGGSNVDAAHFTDAPAGVTASLLTNQASGEGLDSMTNIENLTGSNHNDSLIGNASPTTSPAGAAMTNSSGSKGQTGSWAAPRTTP